MWYLLYCNTDNSYSKVDEKSIMNVGAVKIDDCVTFFYGTKSHLGKVLAINDDEEFIDNELKRLGKRAKRVSKPRQDSEAPNVKRVLKIPCRLQEYSCENSKDKPHLPSKSKCNETPLQEAVDKQVISLICENVSVKGKDANTLEMLNESSDDSDMPIETLKLKKKSARLRKTLIAKIVESSSSEESTASTKQSSSPSKEELKKMLLQAQEKVFALSQASIKPDVDISSQIDLLHSSPKCDNTLTFLETLPSVNVLDHSMESEDSLVGVQNSSVSSLASETQMYGKDYAKEEMVILCNNTYCKKSALQLALCGNASKATHIVRRVLDGVFTREAILRCTLTGQKPRAAGKDRAHPDTAPLNAEAVADIIKYAKEVEKRKGWPKQSQKELERALTQRMGDLKREERLLEEKQQ